MTVKTIYIIRHGYRSNWLPENEQLPILTGVDSDPQLAPHGVEQAKQLAGFISKELSPKPQLIFSSPMYRCVQTVNPTAEALDLDIFIEFGIGEWFKRNRGQIPKPLEASNMKKYFSRVSESWNSHTMTPSQEGETEEEIFNRCAAFWPKFIPKVEQKFPNAECILLLGHAASKITLGMTLMGYKNNRDYLKEEDNGDGKTTRIQAGTCSLDQYKLDENTGKWHLKINGKTSYLQNGTEMNWDYGTSKFVAGSDEDIAYRRKLAEQSKCAESLVDGIPAESGTNYKNGEDQAGIEKDENASNEHVGIENKEDALNEHLGIGGETSLNTGNADKTTQGGENGEEEEKDNEKEEEKEEKDKEEEDDEKEEADDKGKEEEDEEYKSVYVSFAFPPNVNELEQTAETNSSAPRTATANDTNVELEDLKANLQENEATSLEKIQISGLSKKKPLVQMHNNLYMGEWSKLVGTELVFNENGKFVTKVDSHLVLRSGKLANYKMEKESLLKRALELAKKVKDKGDDKGESEDKGETDVKGQTNVKEDNGETTNENGSKAETVPKDAKGEDEEGDVNMED